MGSLLAYWREAGDDSGGRTPMTALAGFPGRAEIAEPQNRAAAGTPAFAQVTALVRRAHRRADEAGI